MRHLVSMVQYEGILNEYRDAQDFSQSLENLAIDGVELVPCDGDPRGIIAPELIEGIHLPIFTAWMDFYHGNTERLAYEYGDQAQWEQFYGGKDFSAVMAQFQKALDDAQKRNVQYVVFHVSEVTMSEVFTGQRYYSDEEVIETAITVINQLLDGHKYTFYFLCENLWWAGFNFQKPSQATRLLEGIHYPKTGFLLDTGHLLCCNLHLRTQVEGCAYIQEIIDAQSTQVRDAILTVHLHQSLSGEIAQAMHRNPTPLTGKVFDKFAQTYDYLNQIDTHSPWNCDGLATVLENLAPRWITHELAFSPREEKEEALLQQRTICPK